MKRIFWIFALCVFLVPQGIWAQENIEKMISNSAEKASKKTHDSYQNDPRSKEISSASNIYYFSDKKLFDSFKAKDYDSHYVLCFPDENPDYRYGYALEWNNKWNGFRVVKVHGEKPGNDFSSLFMGGLDSLRNINWKWISDSVAHELKDIDWQGISDSVAKNLKGINWKGIRPERFCVK